MRLLYQTGPSGRRRARTAASVGETGETRRAPQSRKTSRGRARRPRGASPTLRAADAGGSPEQVVPRHDPRVDARRRARRASASSAAPQRHDARPDILVAQAAGPARCGRHRACEGRRRPSCVVTPPQAAVNHPVVLLLVEEQIAPRRRPRKRPRGPRPRRARCGSMLVSPSATRTTAPPPFGRASARGPRLAARQSDGMARWHVEVGLRKNLTSPGPVGGAFPSGPEEVEH